MEKEFIPYEEALALKELGFDRNCFAWYNSERSALSIGESWRSGLNSIITPTYSQAFRWFREKYNLSSQVESYYLKEWFYFFKIEGTNRNYAGNDGYNFYEEAELACLRKLIEIVKNE